MKEFISNTLIWAFTITIIVMFFLYLFRNPIANVINHFAVNGRRFQFSRKGINVDCVSEDGLNAMANITNSRKWGLKKAFQNPLISERERLIIQDLVEAKYTQEEANKDLILQLAGTQAENQMLWIDRWICVQKIELLEHLNVQLNPASENELSKFYQDCKNKSKNVQKTLNEFLQSLLQANLINIFPNGYGITILGREYLCFLKKYPRIPYVVYSRNENNN